MQYCLTLQVKKKITFVQRRGIILFIHSRHQYNISSRIQQFSSDLVTKDSINPWIFAQDKMNRELNYCSTDLLPELKYLPAKTTYDFMQLFLVSSSIALLTVISH